jgi:environmental stress-induced protein Ves
MRLALPPPCHAAKGSPSVRHRHIRYADLTPAPWKNGGGITREIAIGPEGAAAGGDFLWRLSIAEVSGSGPFSVFPGVDRTLTILEGAGIKLDFAEGDDQVIDVKWRPARFDGGRACVGQLIGGPVTDFNVMTRRPQAAHRVRFIRLSDETLAEALENEVTALLLLQGELVVECGEARATLAPRDSFLVERGAGEGGSLRAVCASDAAALLVEIDLSPGQAQA